MATDPRPLKKPRSSSSQPAQLGDDLDETPALRASLLRLQQELAASNERVAAANVKAAQEKQRADGLAHEVSLLRAQSADTPQIQLIPTRPRTFSSPSTATESVLSSVLDRK